MIQKTLSRRAIAPVIDGLVVLETGAIARRLICVSAELDELSGEIMQMLHS